MIECFCAFTVGSSGLSAVAPTFSLTVTRLLVIVLEVRYSYQGPFHIIGVWFEPDLQLEKNWSEVLAEVGSLSGLSSEGGFP